MTSSSAFHCHLLAAATLISLFMYLGYWVSIVAAFKSKVLNFLVEVDIKYKLLPLSFA